MNYSGDAAEQVVRFSLEGMEVAMKIIGSAAKEMAILLAAALKAEQKTAGKARLSAMLKSGKDLTVFSLPQKDLKKFVQEAKKYGVLYCTIRNRQSKDPNAIVDIITRAEDAPKINRVVERFKLAAVDTAEIVQNIEKAKVERTKPAPEASSVARTDSQEEEDIEAYMGKLDKLFDDIASQSVPTHSRSSEFPSKRGLKEQETVVKPISDKKPSVREKLQREQAKRDQQNNHKMKTAEKAAGKERS